MAISLCSALKRMATHFTDNFVHHAKRHKMINLSGKLGSLSFVIGKLNWTNTAQHKLSIIYRKLARFESQ